MYCMIETASDNKDEIKLISNTILDKKLVASTHIITSESSWNWQNKREEAIEYLLQMKTHKKNIKKIYDIIKEIHSYDCFEFAIYNIESINKDYLNWINTETK